MKKLFSTLVFISLAIMGFSQGSITGKLIDPDTGEGLIGATVLLQGTTTGTVTDYNGSFSIGNLDPGNYTLEFSYVGYETSTREVTVSSGNVDLGVISLSAGAIGLSSIEVVADYAVERKTPVAFAKLDQKKIEKVLGSRDIPLAMNITPSVYATAQGGGSGDARINVRGFDQRNVAIMINGVPVNDMENGWVYWSNWDGIGDATSSIQLQRGLSAVNLATPSIGGTMNIVTSPAEKKAGGTAKLEYGSGNFLKSTITAHSGLINNKFAISASVVRKVGDGIVNHTWTDAWAYYLGTSFIASKSHKFEFFAMGAPQRHGQSLYKQNIAAYSHEFAKSIDGYDIKAFDKFPEAEAGRFYNQNASPVSTSYKGKQWWNGKEHDRYDSQFINERENFFHKPLVNFNWYADWSDMVSQYTVLYYSGGRGGGSGTYGNMRWNYHAGIDSPSRFVYYDGTIDKNANDTEWSYKDKQLDTNYVQTLGAGQARGILRNSRNNQWTLGGLSKFKIKWNSNVKSTIGLDWRKAEIDHFREVRDLLGGNYFSTRDVNGNKLIDKIKENGNVEYKFKESDFWEGDDFKRKLGDKIAYDNTNTVDWLGFFAQTEYTLGMFSVYGMVGYSQIKYSFTDHFTKDANTGKEFFLETNWISGLQVKGGANYRITENMNVFANLGYVNKVPIFDAVIDDRSGTRATDPKNEKFYAGELGANFFSSDNTLKLKLGGYYTKWKDRTKRFSVNEQDGSSDLIYVTGMDQLHAGLEIDVTYQPMDLFEVGLSGSFADWKNTNDVSGEYRSFVNGVYEDRTYDYYVKDLYVGDAPQTQVVGSLTFFPVKGLSAQFLMSYYSKFYAQWDPFSRNDEGDREQSWKIPAYSLLNMHLHYDLPLKGRMKVGLFVHGFNLLDKMYISDAVDNSKYNAYMGENNENSHKASAAEVFLGLPRRFNAGIKVGF